MFNGIIYQQGTISNFVKLSAGTKIFVKSKLKLNKKDIGSSIACDGVCLTLVSKRKNLLEFYLSKESINKSKFKHLKIGQKINLELPLKYGQDISGHICQGHVDCTSFLKKIKKVGKSIVFEFKIENKFSKYLIPKASILINGVSLTISKIIGNKFQIWCIPHTLKLTNLSKLKVNDIVNIEIDILSKYVKNFYENKKI